VIVCVPAQRCARSEIVAAQNLAVVAAAWLLVRCFREARNFVVAEASPLRPTRHLPWLTIRPVTGNLLAMALSRGCW
jgi:hypothetical protein